MPVAQYPSNLLDIMSSGSIAAGDMARKQFEAAQLADLMSQQKAQQDYNFAAEKHPIELEQSRANVGRTLADTAYTKENTESSRLKNAYDRDTLHSRIQTALADNDAKRAADIVSRTNAYAQHLSQLADYMDKGGTIPLDADLPPEVKQLAAQGTKAMRSYAKSITFNDPAYLRDMAKQNDQQSFQSGENRLSRESAERIAGMRQAGKGGNKTVQQMVMSAKNTEDLVSKLEVAQLMAQTDEERLMYAEASANAKALWEAKLQAGFKPGLDTPAIANLPGTKPPTVPGAASKQAPTVQLPGGITVRVKPSSQ